MSEWKSTYSESNWPRFLLFFLGSWPDWEQNKVGSDCCNICVFTCGPSRTCREHFSACVKTAFEKIANFFIPYCVIRSCFVRFGGVLVCFFFWFLHPMPSVFLLLAVTSTCWSLLTCIHFHHHPAQHICLFVLTFKVLLPIDTVEKERKIKNRITDTLKETAKIWTKSRTLLRSIVFSQGLVILHPNPITWLEICCTCNIRDTLHHT